MSDANNSTTLPREVVVAELEVIRARRQTTYGNNSNQQDQLKDIENNLRGLSISGGGIRSSTFSIGVIQSLAKAKLVEDFDYVSTVSGGGYTGSLLSTMLNSEDDTPDDFPLEMPVGKEESRLLQHLRNGSNYLAPGGFLEFIRMPAVVVRGLILNFLLLLPWIMATVYLTEIIHEYVPTLNIYASITASEPGLYGFWTLLITLTYFALSGWRSIEGKWSRRNGYELWVARAFLLIIVAVLLGPVSQIIVWAIQEPWHSLEATIADIFTIATLTIVATLILVAALLVKVSKNLSAIAGKLVIIGLGILGPALVFGVYILLVIAQVDSPFMTLDKPLYTDQLPSLSTPIELSLDESQIQIFNDKDLFFKGGKGNYPINLSAVYCGKDNWVFRNPASNASNPSKADCLIPVEKAEISGLVRLVPPVSWPALNSTQIAQQKYQSNATYEIYGAKLHLGGTRGPTTFMDDNAFLLLTIALFILNYFYINVNQSSLHGFYRDRLSKLYLIRRNRKGEAVHLDAIKLSELNNTGTYAPYHIVNSTLNLQGDTVESQRGRDSDFFFFSKLYCGGTHTGYCETKKMEKCDKHMNLGTAMAISAAAAAPNMGSTTNKSLTFILTLMNIRLGYWVPNPCYVAKGKRIPKPSGKYLWREAAGDLKSNSRLVNVSDGGHLENLAIYEMLRRRCMTIVCIDGEADPDHTFNGLITLIRIARIDLGIEIIIDLDNLRLEKGMSKEHFSIGRIIYGGETKDGVLIYVKSSFTKSSEENPFLFKYKAENPTFPHETTADQFFDERQFEAYRALGESIGREFTRKIDSKEISWPVGHL